MILVRFKNTFRERLPEWITSIGLIFWGLIVLSEPTTLFQDQYFSVLANIAAQNTWGIVAVLVGFSRIVALIINGAWRPTAHLRAVGAFLSAMLWAAIIISYITLPWNPPALAAKGCLLVVDLFALWFAAGDAKMADLRARSGNGYA